MKCDISNNNTFIVSERVQVNSDYSRAMRTLTFLLFKLNSYQRANSSGLKSVLLESPVFVTD